MLSRKEFLSDVNKLKTDIFALSESSIEVDESKSNDPNGKSFIFDIGEQFILLEDIQAQSFKYADIEDILHGKVQEAEGVEYYTLNFVINCIDKFALDYLHDEF